MEEEVIIGSLYQEDIYRIPPKLTIVLSQPWNKTSEDEKVLLTKILAAVDQTMNEARIVWKLSFDLSGWKDKPSKVIAFGASAPGLPNYEVIKTDNTETVISSSLNELLHDDTAKRKLWQGLRQLFKA